MSVCSIDPTVQKTESRAVGRDTLTESHEQLLTVGVARRFFCVAYESVTWSYWPALNTYTIFEGTSEVQRLVISRAISGIHIN